MQTDYPAHIRVFADGHRTVQTCAEHSRNAAKYAGEVLDTIGLRKCAYLAGILHDTGKFKTEYKEYLERAVDGENVHRGSVIHTFAGVRFLLERYHALESELTFDSIVCEILAYAIGAHHGLFDCINEHHENGFLHRIQSIPEGDIDAIRNFLIQCVNQAEIDELFREAVEELTPLLQKCSEMSPDYEETTFLLGLIVRLLTSAVIEGDRRDTAEFMDDVVFPPAANRTLWMTLLERVEKKIDTFPCDTQINRARRKISDTCRKFAAKQPGIYRLNVPTGGGKTLSSLRYALAHAAEFEKKRIIFVSPLLSILDQNSKVIRDCLQADEIILEHHSNVIHEKNSSEKWEQYELLTENWSSPIMITTLVQLLNTMFDGKTSSIRRFYALADSVIVIDEVQTVPNKMLTLFHLAISFLAEICHSTVILCSATQPCDEAVAHPIRAAVGDIVPYDPKLWDIFKRTELRHAGSYRLEDIPALGAKILESADSLLIVCNKKEEAETLYIIMKEMDCNLFHLSASMCMAHRKAVLADLYHSLSSENPRKTVCVSTQVIEAGVDISFGAVIRLTAGLDSIIQSAGRCNRNGESDISQPVYIVRAENENLSHLPEIQMAKQATEQLLAIYEQNPGQYGNDLSSDKAVQYYYRQLFSIQQKNNREYHDLPSKNLPTIFSLLAENEHWISENDDTAAAFMFHQAFASAGAAFTVFDNDTTDVIVPYGEGESVINDLLSERAKHDIAFVQERLSHAKGYTVSLYAHQKKKLEENHGLIPLAGGIMLGLASEYYSSQTGLITNEIERGHGECATQIW
ncbi:MAG: CRISPR-associated helicase Cas3' [Clostridia bacterium]|nr:CRISPR-associated helicase Cas3' [Clostridia bacterium]